MNRVLADGDAVTVVELLLLDRLAVDERAVGAPEVDDPELLAAPLDAGMMPAGGRVSKYEVVVGRAAQTQSAVSRAVRVTRVRS